MIEVAIVRPGPIQGGMVHPYLKSRERLRKGQDIDYESAALKPALERTLGVPIFQEQVMQIAMIAADFSADEADRLRRSMAAWKRKGGVRQVPGPADRRHGRTTAIAGSSPKRIFKQIQGFGEYGFPESHAASFALLAYDSSWLKCHEPECFLAAMLNSQPMGFYSPIATGAGRAGATACRCCRSMSRTATGTARWSLTPMRVRLRILADSDSSRPAVRLGLRHGRQPEREAAAQRIVAGARRRLPSPAPKTWPCAPNST